MKPERTEIPSADELERERRDAIRIETSAMAAAFGDLQPLDYNARKRALRWLGDALENVEVPF